MTEDTGASRLALVTGAARGLGRGIALGLAEAGWDVAVNDLRDDDAAQETASAVRACGRRAWVEPADVSDEAQVDALFVRLAQRGGVHALINNAGIAHAADIFTMTLADWRRVIDINLTSCFLCSRRAAAQMRDTGGGRIVSIASVSGQQGALFGHVHYSASKAGIIGFTKALARTLAPHAVTVNAVAPGIIDTDLLRRTHGDDGVEHLAAGIPLGLGEARDVAGTVGFLCSEAGRYVTGATLDVNGGMYLR
ncbi:MAG: SDR family NAD(P)-dependent oxidoreductase [Planctomycetota bacterium]|jgi:3-oxoacyl-[acyl-carrier protein] reductase|nr:SDR family NAD(P)-dependent oxidoreductase [Planctomycetota bacterium]